MADETPKETKSKGSVVKFAIIGFFAFLVTVVIAGTVLFLTMNKGGQKTAPKVKTEKKEEIGPLVPVGNDIIVNLKAGEDGMERYLKVNITLEVNTVEGQEELTARIPQVRDLIINILSRNTKDKIDEKEGKELIRSEIIKAINSHLIGGKVKNLFFQDFVVQ